MVREKNGEINQIGVSMFHQLHCLSMVRAMLLKGDTHMDHNHVESRDMNQGAKDRGHFLHCFDYIVQVRNSPATLRLKYLISCIGYTLHCR